MNPGVAPSLLVVWLSLSPALDHRSYISKGVEVHVVLLFCGAGD